MWIAVHKHSIKQHIYVSYNLSFDCHPTPSNFLFNSRLAIFIKKVYNTDMKPRAHRVCTFSRLFSDFQNSLALRNTTESSLTEGRSCFPSRLIGQDKEMSVFFPHLSKAEHVKQRKISGKSMLSTLPCSLRGRAPTTARTSALRCIWPHRRRFRVPPAFG